MIILSDITLSFGERILFDHISLTLHNNHKVGLVGNNGAGKSTLLKAIAGLCAVEGSITITKDTRIAYMPQEVVLSSEKKVFDETFSVFHAFLTLEKELHEIEQQLELGSVDEHILEQYCVIQEQLQSFDKARATARTTALLSDLGFTESMMQQITNTLSVGWKMRVVLAQLLLQEADFYLFDEPTNHLDLNTKEWFLEFLKQSSFGYLLISHDRRFLQEACTKIYELEYSKGTLYHGNYDSYTHQKTERTSFLENAYDRQQKEIEQRTKLIDRFKGKASKARMAQSMIKKLEKIEKIELPPEPPHINITFPPMQQPGKIVLTLEEIGHSFDEKKLFSHASCEIKEETRLLSLRLMAAAKQLFLILLQERSINNQDPSSLAIM